MMFQRMLASFSEGKEVHFWFVERFSVEHFLMYLESHSSSKKNFQSVLVMSAPSWELGEKRNVWMEVIKVSPRSYCYGVVNALQGVQQAVKDTRVPRLISLLGQIIHNRHAVEAVVALGVITLHGPDQVDLLEQVTGEPSSHGPWCLASGQNTCQRGLHCIDTICPDVTLTHQLVPTMSRQDCTILYIGKWGHPEPEGVLGDVPGREGG
jgi:hypothetical protein